MDIPSVGANKGTKREEFTSDDLQRMLEQMTGQELPLQTESDVLQRVAKSISCGQAIGYSQFNELLLSVGYDRVCREFFVFICNAPRRGGNQSQLQDISSGLALADGIRCFRKLSLVQFGNTKFGFKTLSRDPKKLTLNAEQVMPRAADMEFRARHEALIPLKSIEKKDAPLLGYISGGRIEEDLKSDPENPKLIERGALKDKARENGTWNHKAYLTYDHIDVYVATSMREEHEFAFVYDFMAKIEANAHIRDLKLRFFDPTKAYCKNRIDKGLAEALMLKRARCTIYLIQESDTFGKDSELASTLAQGKPVIAFVPRMSPRLWEYLINTFKEIYPGDGEAERLLRIIRIYNAESAWTVPEIQKHISDVKALTVEQLASFAKDYVEKHYDKRAGTLKDHHPLGLQSNLESGVANGVLVARTMLDCARMLRGILLNTLEYDIKDEEDGSILLNERISKCTYRVMTSDRLLTNSFWNFYK